MIRPILLWPNSLLSKVSDSIDVADLPKAQALATDLVETMVAGDGVGLAAPQIGVSLRVVVIGLSGYTRVLLNPSFEPDPEAPQVPMGEGCLSMPGVEAQVSRPAFGWLRYTDLQGIPTEMAADGMLARAAQHEIDHLDGFMFHDRLSLAKRLLKTKPYLKRWGSHGSPRSWDPTPEPSPEQKAIVAARALRKEKEAREAKTRIRVVENDIIKPPGLLDAYGNPIHP